MVSEGEGNHMCSREVKFNTSNHKHTSPLWSLYKVIEIIKQNLPPQYILACQFIQKQHRSAAELRLKATKRKVSLLQKLADGNLEGTEEEKAADMDLLTEGRRALNIMRESVNRRESVKAFADMNLLTEGSQFKENHFSL
jgi:hypothetical protein